MKARLLGSLMVAGLMAGPAVASDFDNRWYIAPGAGFMNLDDDRNTSDQSAYYSLSLGRFLTRDFSLDLRHDRYHGNIDGVPAGQDRFKLRNLGLVGRYHFADFEFARPYVLAGLGIQEHDSIFESGRDIYAALGLGLSHSFTDRLNLRLEAEWRRDNDRDTFNRSSGFDDIIYSAALKFKLGAARRAPQPEPAPQPVAPAPRPTPPPAPAPAPEPEPEVIFELDSTVMFDLDSARLRSGAAAELNEVVALMNLHPEIRRIEVAGHTCDLGSAEYNTGLSQRRAQSVRDYLVDNGVEANRLAVRGYGEDRPAVPNTSESNRQKNRRVEIVVLERASN
ncbi:MAG: OmpA family protein [Wenzhouxiangella sp.]